VVLVIAIGNPIHGDDGAAGRAVRGIEAARRDVEVITVQGLLPEHAESVADSEGTVFVDARAGSAPGAVEVEAVTPSGGGLADPHALGPAALLAMARELYGVAPPAAAVTVGAGTLELGEELSPAVAAALPELRDAVLGVIDGWRREDRRHA